MKQNCLHCGSLKHTSKQHNEVLENCKHIIAATNKWRNIFKDVEDFATFKQPIGAVCWSEKEHSYIGIAGDGKEVLLPSTVEQCELYLESRPNPIDW